MAVLYNDASSNYITWNTPPATAVPLTFAVWFYNDDATAGNRNMFQLQDSAVSGHYFRVALRDGTDARDILAATSGTGGYFEAVTTTQPCPVNQWNHCCAVYAATNSRVIYANHGTSVSNGLTSTPSNIDSLTIGGERDATPGDYWSGGLFWPAIWDVALTADEILTLYKGAPPWTVRPESLIFFSPFYQAGDYTDWISGNAPSTVNGTPTTMESPHVTSMGGIMIPSVASLTNTNILVPMGPPR